MPEIYEYAGFNYYVIHVPGGIEMRPVEGQHPAAQKEKHRRAARDCYLQDHA